MPGSETLRVSLLKPKSLIFISVSSCTGDLIFIFFFGEALPAAPAALFLACIKCFSHRVLFSIARALHLHCFPSDRLQRRSSGISSPPLLSLPTFLLRFIGSNSKIHKDIPSCCISELPDLSHEFRKPKSRLKKQARNKAWKPNLGRQKSREWRCFHGSDRDQQWTKETKREMGDWKSKIADRKRSSCKVSVHEGPYVSSFPSSRTHLRRFPAEFTCYFRSMLSIFVWGHRNRCLFVRLASEFVCRMPASVATEIYGCALFRALSSRDQTHSPLCAREFHTHPQNCPLPEFQIRAAFPVNCRPQRVLLLPP